jgi:GAF domain-containing protein
MLSTFLRRAGVAVIGGLLIVSSCGGGGEGAAEHDTTTAPVQRSDAPGEPSSDTADDSRRFESAEALAQAIGCTGFELIEDRDSLEQMAEQSTGQTGAELAESMLSVGVESWGGCELDGMSVEITTYEGAPYREPDLTDDPNMINTGGAVPIYGENWGALVTDLETFDQATEEEVDTANTIVEQVGGSVQN